MSEQTSRKAPRRAMPLLECHQTLLADSTAQEAFRAAIKEVTKGGETVLEIGTGTGIHAMFFCQAGARLVHAVEQSVVIELARVICATNGCSDRIAFHHLDAENLLLDDKVDIIAAHLGLSDTLALLPLMKARHLREGGVSIPAEINIFCAPIERRCSARACRILGHAPAWHRFFAGAVASGEDAFHVPHPPRQCDRHPRTSSKI